jgi:steroid Delta-isomerase
VSLLDEHVERFNEGVRSGDFAPMVAGFSEDAELHFEGVPVGPFLGRDAIDAAYREQPPDDEVEIFDSEEREGEIVARYSWLRDEGRQSGEMRLTPRGGRIQRLVVTFD